MIKNALMILWLATLILGCETQHHAMKYTSDSLQVLALTKNTYIHTTFLDTEKYGKVPCNGMIVADQGEALVFDTPTTDSVAEELIHWIEKTLKVKVTGIMVNHFHIDCLGGLDMFHQRNIPSYALHQTIRLAAEGDQKNVPQIGFEKYSELEIGGHKILTEFLGEGHTIDNTISYYPKDNILFGGCLVKSIGAGKGNLADANEAAWANTIRKVKEKYGKSKIIIPGHGKYGGSELLDYTIQKFEYD